MTFIKLVNESENLYFFIKACYYQNEKSVLLAAFKRVLMEGH